MLGSRKRSTSHCVVNDCDINQHRNSKKQRTTKDHQEGDNHAINNDNDPKSKTPNPSQSDQSSHSANSSSLRNKISFNIVATVTHLFALVLSFLPRNEGARISQTCRSFQKAFKHPALWSYVSEEVIGSHTYFKSLPDLVGWISRAKSHDFPIPIRGLQSIVLPYNMKNLTEDAISNLVQECPNLTSFCVASINDLTHQGSRPTTPTTTTATTTNTAFTAQQQHQQHHHHQQQQQQQQVQLRVLRVAQPSHLGGPQITVHEVSSIPSLTSLTDSSLLSLRSANLQTLHISHQPQVSNEGIINLLQQLPKLKDIIICCCTKITGDILPVVMGLSNGIQKFVLTNQPVNIPGQHPRSSAQSHIPETTRTEVNECNLLAAIKALTQKQAQIESAVSTSSFYGSTLKDFRISIHSSVEPETLTRLLSMQPTIQKLKLTGCRLESNFIQDALSLLPALEHFHIVGPKCNNEIQRHQLNGALRISHPTLRKLSLGYLTIPTLCVDRTPSLLKLKIVRSSFNTAPFSPEQSASLHLSLVSRRSLRKISIEHVRFDTDDFSDSFLHDFDNLTTLRLIGVTSIRKLAIMEMPRLTHLVVHQLADLLECQINAPELKTVTLEYCMNLSSLEIHAPKLGLLFLFSLPLMSHPGQGIALQTFKLYSNGLRALNLSKCSSLSNISIHCPHMSVLSLPVLRFGGSLVSSNELAPQVDLNCPSLKALTVPYDRQGESIFHVDSLRQSLYRQCPNISALNIICTTSPPSAPQSQTGEMMEMDRHPDIDVQNSETSLRRQSDDGMLHEIFSSWKDIKVLVMRNAGSLTSAALQSCTQYVMFYGCPNLRSLSFTPSVHSASNALMRIYLDNCASVSDDMLNYLTAQCPMLMMLRVTNCANVVNPTLQFRTFDPVVLANASSASVSSDSSSDSEHSSSPSSNNSNNNSGGGSSKLKPSMPETSSQASSALSSKTVRIVDITSDKCVRDITFSACASLQSIRFQLDRTIGLENEASHIINRVNVVNCASLSSMIFRVACLDKLNIRKIQIDQCPFLTNFDTDPKLVVNEDFFLSKSDAQ